MFDNCCTFVGEFSEWPESYLGLNRHFYVNRNGEQGMLRRSCLLKVRKLKRLRPKLDIGPSDSYLPWRPAPADIGASC